MKHDNMIVVYVLTISVGHSSRYCRMGKVLRRE